MPILQSFHEQYGDRVAVLGVDYEDPQTVAAMELVADTGVTYPLLADPQGDLRGADALPGLRGLPFLALVDEDGRVAHQAFVQLESERPAGRPGRRAPRGRAVTGPTTGGAARVAAPGRRRRPSRSPSTS